MSEAPALGAAVRAAVVGLGAHAATCALLSAVGAAHVRAAAPRVLLVPVVVVVVVLAARPDAATPALLVALAWLVAGLAHHYLVGIDAQWGSEPVRGLGHVAWDAAFHAPPVLLAAVAWPRALRSEAG